MESVLTIVLQSLITAILLAVHARLFYLAGFYSGKGAQLDAVIATHKTGKYVESRNPTFFKSDK